MSSAVLVVVDLQNDFVARYPGDPARMVEVAANTATAVDLARAGGVEVVFVRFAGDLAYQGASWRRRDLALGKSPKCLEDSSGARFHQVAPVPGERVFTKRARFDAFLTPGFEEHLVQRGTERLVLAGLFTDVCVDSTARTAFQKGFDVTVLTDCTAALHLPDAEILRFMNTVYGARLANHNSPDIWAPPRDHAGVQDGVGLTALMVATARAIETHRPDALASDPHAEHLVRAAEVSAAWPVRPADVPDGDANPLWGRLGRYFGLRTRVLDDHLLRAANAGVRQVVLLGAGLDTRAYRLDWPSGLTVYELDREGVLAFKHDVLATTPPATLAATPATRPAATPAATRRAVAVDLRDDWDAALEATGFDRTAPTAWLAEGLLLYLPAAAERRLIATVDRLSAEGSSLAFEVKVGVEAPQVRASPVYAAARQQIGVDLLALFDSEPRPDSAADLRERGWSTDILTPFDFARQHGRGPLPEPNDALASNRWVFARRWPVQSSRS